MAKSQTPEIKKKTPLKTGRPSSYRDNFPKIVTDEMAKGCAIVEVCKALDISKDTFYRYVKTRSEFSDAYKKGLNLSEAWWVHEAHISMRDRTFNAVLWYMNMKNRFGWHDQKPAYKAKKIPGFEGDLNQKSKAADTALKDGVLSTDEHNLVMGSLLSEARILEIDTLVKRVAKLEAQWEKK